MDALEAQVVSESEQAWAEEVDLCLLQIPGETAIEQAMDRYDATRDWSEFDVLSDDDKNQIVCLLHLVFGELQLRAGQKLVALNSEPPT